MRYKKTPLHPELGMRPNLLKWLSQPRHTFDAKSLAMAGPWQRRVRRAFLKCLGEAPQPVPLRPRVLERKQLDGYHRTTLLLNTAPHIKALCWLCVPDGASASGPRPAMIATPGHGTGALEILAMDESGRPRREGEGYQRDYALQAVRLGKVVLVIEPFGFGQRRDAEQMAGESSDGCQTAANLATMLGMTLARLRIHDLQRGVDYLETLPAVDSKRIGLMGISGGGQMTLWTAAVEPRLKLAVVSGYLNRFRDSVMAMSHCICNFAPGLARELDMADLAGLVAPRPILIEGGTKDSIFPIRGTRAAIRRAKEIYRVFNAGDRVSVDLFEDKHVWSGRKLGAFLDKWL